MFRNVDQLRTESHIDTFEAKLADALHTLEAKTATRSSMGATTTSVLGDIKTTRSQLGHKEPKPPKPGAHRQQHSQNRVEQHYGKELSGWFEIHQKDKLRKEDAFYAKPVANMGSSCVKYDIITNERKQFWY